MTRKNPRYSKYDIDRDTKEGDLVQLFFEGEGSYVGYRIDSCLQPQFITFKQFEGITRSGYRRITDFGLLGFVNKEDYTFSFVNQHTGNIMPNGIPIESYEIIRRKNTKEPIPF
jgi:hypothetical protein